jgi:hypothetical protein
MNNSPLKAVSILTALMLIAGSAWATTGVIQGDVKGPGCKALSGAQVHLQRTGDKNSATTAKTDAKGRYVFQGLTMGSYNLTASANGMAATAAQNVTTSPSGAISVNFNLKHQTGAATSAAPKKKATKMVYMPPEMGSNLGGRWVEVNEDDPRADVNHTDTVKSQDKIRKMLSGGGLNKTGN